MQIETDENREKELPNEHEGFDEILFCFWAINMNLECLVFLHVSITTTFFSP